MNTRKNSRLVYNFIWLLCLLGGVFYFYTQGKVVSDITQFMPQTSRHAQLNMLLSELQQGAASRYLIVSVRGKDTATTVRLSHALKQYLSKQADFNKVENGSQIISFSDVADLYPYRYLLTPTTGFTTEALHKSLEKRLTDLRSGMGPMLNRTLTSDPQNRFLHYLWQLSSRGQPQRYQGVWFDQQHESAMLLVALAGHGFNLDQQEKAIQIIRSFIQRQPKAAAAQLQMSGPATMAVATRASIRASMVSLSIISGGLMVVLFIWAYRSIRHLLIAGLPLMSAIVAALVLTNLLFGQVHGIVVAFGITLLGVCLDMPLHLFSHLSQQDTPEQTLRSIWPTLRLTVVTTAFSYVALLGTGFTGLSQLAVFAMTGLTTALLVTRWIVPLWLSHVHQEIQRPTLGLSHLHFSNRFQSSVILLGLLVPLVVLLFNAGHLWSRDISQLSPIPEAARQLDQRLRTQMAVPDASHAFFVTAPSAEAVLQKVEALRPTLVAAQAQGLFKQVFAVSDLLPSQKTQRKRQQLLPDRASLKHALLQAMSGLPFRPESFTPFLQAVEQSKTLKPLTWQQMLQTPLADIIKQSMFVHNGQWVSMLRISGIVDRQQFQQWLQNQPALAAHYLDMRHASSELMLDYQQTALGRLLIGILIIAVLVTLVLRSVRKMWRVILPIILAVLLTVSVQVMLGTQLTLFHILSLLLVVGMGLDYSLFFNRPVSNDQDLNKRTHGVMMSAASTLAAFGVLAFAGIPVLAAMGQTVSMGVLSCYVLSQLLAAPEPVTANQSVV